MTLWSPLCLAQVLFLLGTLIFAMSLQLDRRGAWNMMGPCLFAFVVMVTMWVRSWEASAPALTPPLVVGIRESGLPADPDSGTRAWPVILAMFLLLGLSPASVEDCRGHPRGPHTASCPGPGPDICQVLVPLGPLQAVTPTVPLSRPTGPLGAVAAACCANAHGMVLSRCTAAGTGATATPPPGSAGSSTSCPASRWLLWPLPSIPP